MDKLNEPEFTPDTNWPRLFHGSQEMREVSNFKYSKYLAIIGGFSVFRYLREVTYYKKNYTTAAVIVPLFLLTSHWIAESSSYDPYLIAVEKNNDQEKAYIAKYKSLMREAKGKGINVPNELVY